MIGWGIALAVLAAIWFFPLGVLLHYDVDGFRVKLILCFLRIPVHPRNNAPKKKKKAKKNGKTAPAARNSSQPSEKNGGRLEAFLPVAKPVLELLTEFRKALRINRLELELVLAGGSPDLLAVSYGRAWAALGALDTALENSFRIRHKRLELQCDFCGSHTTVCGHLELTITLGRLLRLGIRHGSRILLLLSKNQKNRKGSAAQ